jgi:uncharacterized protein YodC (DUF2158 family)
MSDNLMDKRYLCRINLKSMSEFIAGNKVRAKSINAEMTVVRVIGSEASDELVFVNTRGYEIGDVICEWLDSEERTKTDVFKKSSLELVESD